MEYFTERHNLRESVKKTESINFKVYELLLNKCENRFTNLAWKFPDYCPDDEGSCSNICGVDKRHLMQVLKDEIPSLRICSVYNIIKKLDLGWEGSQYSILDLIEFVYKNIKDVSSGEYHSFFRHHHLYFRDSKVVNDEFRVDINKTFQRNGLLFELNENGKVERIVENGVVGKEVEDTVKKLEEKGTRELIKEAISLHKNPRPEFRKLATEKIWDAFERLKTIHYPENKKESASKIVEDMSHGENHFSILLNTEFEALTKIGNNFNIRHYECNKFKIIDEKHYDYLFNRCLSLISLAIHYLPQEGGKYDREVET
jgi:hypothetical protein